MKETPNFSIPIMLISGSQIAYSANRLFDRLAQGFSRSVRYSEANLIAIGLVGLLGFPSYYLVWEYLFPQPYENLYLRLLGSLLFVPIALISYWPDALKKYFRYFWLATITYALPFFFSYMLFMNDASAVWGMSSMAAILLLFLVLDDWVAINLIYLLGNLMAWYTYSEVTGVTALPEAYLEQLPIYLFSLIAGSIFSHRNELLKQERLFVMSAIGSSIAHELRTPLQGIQSGLAGLKRYLPALIDGYRAAKENRLQVPRIRSAHLAALDELITRIENEIEYSHGFIGMLLMNSGKLQIDTSQFGWVSVRHCIEAAIERYPFSSAEDRKKVMLDPNGNFSFYGSDVLFSHVLFNLIKNALWYIHKAGKGDIRIKIVPGGERDLVVFRDGGAGIHPMVLPNIFDQFYSTQDSAKGAGIGLSFCKLAMESFGGTIKAASEYGSYAEFTMSFSRKIHVQE